MAVGVGVSVAVEVGKDVNVGVCVGCCVAVRVGGRTTVTAEPGTLVDCGTGDWGVVITARVSTVGVTVADGKGVESSSDDPPQLATNPRVKTSIKQAKALLFIIGNLFKPHHHIISGVFLPFGRKRRSRIPPRGLRFPTIVRRDAADYQNSELGTKG